MDNTWRDFTPALTPEQCRFLERCDANPDHPGGLDAHRRGLITVARMLGQLGPGRLN